MARDCTIEGTDGKLDFLLFPEGTIVTVSTHSHQPALFPLSLALITSAAPQENTRGISSKFAEKANCEQLGYLPL